MLTENHLSYCLVVCVFLDLNHHYAFPSTSLPFPWCPPYLCSAEAGWSSRGWWSDHYCKREGPAGGTGVCWEREGNLCPPASPCSCPSVQTGRWLGQAVVSCSGWAPLGAASSTLFSSSCYERTTKSDWYHSNCILNMIWFDPNFTWNTYSNLNKNYLTV